MTAPIWAGMLSKSMLLGMRRRIALVVALLLSLQGVGFIPADAAETKQAQIVEWNYLFNLAEIDIPTSIGNRSWTHSEMKLRVPFYDQVYGLWPVSVRYPNEIYIEKTNAADTCYQIPVQFRAEIDISYLRDANNPIEIEFWPRVIFSDNTITFREPSLKVTPLDWSNTNGILTKSVSICLSKELLGNSLLGINLRFNLLYSRLFSEYNTPTGECWSHTTERCTYIGLYGAGVTVNQISPVPKDEVEGYMKNIAELKTALSFQQSIDKRSIELSRRNLTFLESDLAQAKTRKEALIAEAKAAAELKAKQEAEAKAAAELKAKQEAEAKAAAELKAKQEAEARAAALKKTTITCLKGKLVKKVIAVKPVCPKGYKKK